MDLLSLGRQSQEPAPRLTRTEALVVSFGVHLLVLLLILYLPGWLPDSVLAFLAPQPPAVRPVEAVPLEQPAEELVQPPSIPLKFAYVKIPNDTAVQENPAARLLSDKNRRARQEVPTPPDAQRFSIDPHSEGDTIDRVLPDPTRPAGQDAPEPVEPQAVAGMVPETAPEAPDDSAQTGGGMQPETGVQPGTGAQRVAAMEGALGHAGPAGPDPGTAPDEGASSDAEGGSAGDASQEMAREGLERALSEIETGEYKFTFNNPAYLRGGNYGTMSFDTQGFPWGEYARYLYVVIRNSWLERIPLAAREGIAGYVCQRFVIARQGDVVEIRAVRPSSIPPFDRAAADAISASSPLRPLPEAFPHDSEGVTFCFFYNMYPGEAE